MPPLATAAFFTTAILTATATILIITIGVTVVVVLAATNWEIERESDRRVTSSE